LTSQLVTITRQKTCDIQADTSPEGGGGLSFELASSAEHATWLQRSLECCKQLGQWEDVRNATVFSIAKEQDPNTLWQDARTRDWAIPCYLDALLQVPQFHGELRSFMDAALKVGLMLGFGVTIG